MKIGSFDNKPVGPAAPAATERKGTGATSGAAAGGSEASAKVALSPAASAMVQAKDDASFDAAKVERIASAIRDGSYRIDAEAIADKLIVNAEELLGRKLS